MRKFYNAPLSRCIELENVDVILSASNPQNDLNIGIGQGTDDGFNALGNEKDIWGNEDIWK